MICTKCGKNCEVYKLLNLSLDIIPQGPIQILYQAACPECIERPRTEKPSQDIIVRSQCFAVLNAPIIDDKGNVQ